MKTCVIACKTIQRELEKVYEEVKCDFPVFWLESGLHNVPEKLKAALQEMISNAQEYNRILLCMGYCGNSVQGICAEHAQIIVPRVDDCISLLLGSVKKRHELVAGCGTYFLTKGWLDGEKNIWAEYQYTIEKYGRKRGKQISKIMLANYKRLGVLDTKAYPLEKIVPETEMIARELGLQHEVLPATEAYMNLLLTGPWNEEQFLIVEPGEKIQLMDLMKFY